MVFLYVGQGRCRNIRTGVYLKVRYLAPADSFRETAFAVSSQTFEGAYGTSGIVKGGADNSPRVATKLYLDNDNVFRVIRAKYRLGGITVRSKKYPFSKSAPGLEQRNITRALVKLRQGRMRARNYKSISGSKV